MRNLAFTAGLTLRQRIVTATSSFSIPTIIMKMDGILGKANRRCNDGGYSSVKVACLSVSQMVPQ